MPQFPLPLSSLSQSTASSSCLSKEFFSLLLSNDDGTSLSCDKTFAILLIGGTGVNSHSVSPLLLVPPFFSWYYTSSSTRHLTISSFVTPVFCFCKFTVSWFSVRLFSFHFPLQNFYRHPMHPDFFAQFTTVLYGSNAFLTHHFFLWRELCSTRRNCFK